MYFEHWHYSMEFMRHQMMAAIAYVALKLNFMKKYSLFFLLLLLAASCRTASASAEKPLGKAYLTGNNEPAVSSAGSRQPAVGDKAPECPVYYTGKKEPAGSTGVVSFPDEQR